MQAAGVNRLSTDAFSVAPLEGLGRVYYVICFIYTRPNKLVEGPTQFGVVSTADDTAVTVLLPRADMQVGTVEGVQRNGRSISFRMNAYETFQVTQHGSPPIILILFLLKVAMPEQNNRQKFIQLAETQSLGTEIDIHLTIFFCFLYYTMQTDVSLSLYIRWRTYSNHMLVANDLN